MTPSDVIAVAAEVFEIPAEEITGPSKCRTASWARFMCAHEIALIRSWWPLQRITLAIGRHDHGTASHAILRHSELIASDPQYLALHGKLIEGLHKFQTNHHAIQTHT